MTQEELVGKPIIEQDPSGGLTFGGIVFVMVAIAGVVGLVMYHYSGANPPPSPEPVIIKSPPEIRYVEKPAPPPASAGEPAPAPVAAQPPPPPSLPPAPPSPKAEVRSIWDGVWRRQKYPLPMFSLKAQAGGIVGRYAPNWSEIAPLNGTAQGDTVQFVTSDPLLRVHFRMTMLGTDMAMVEGWMTDEDFLAALSNANRIARTPRQALAARLLLEDAGKRLGKPISLGMFIRGGSILEGLPDLQSLMRED
jgi:hypothetical protein